LRSLISNDKNWYDIFVLETTSPEEEDKLFTQRKDL
jgi:hypothetical protein